MTPLPSHEWLEWIAPHQIGRDPKYSHSSALVFLNEEATWRRYRPERSPEFLERAVTVAAAGGAFWSVSPVQGGLLGAQPGQ